MPVLAASNFERFFHAAAGLDVDKNDVRRYSDFVNQKTRDLLVVAEASAQAGGRDVIAPRDLPITHGLQRTMHEFRKLDEQHDFTRVLRELIVIPPLDLSLGAETESRLPEFVGGLSLGLARTFTVLDPKVRNPQSDEWERALRIFDLLL
jgi:hypothetical protein